MDECRHILFLNGEQSLVIIIFSSVKSYYIKFPQASWETESLRELFEVVVAKAKLLQIAKPGMSRWMAEILLPDNSLQLSQ
jgi:hypothetical protein